MTGGPDRTAIVVRGNATAEELAAVVAVVSSVDGGARSDGFSRWRGTRLAALRSTAPASARER